MGCVVVCLCVCACVCLQPVTISQKENNQKFQIHAGGLVVRASASSTKGFACMWHWYHWRRPATYVHGNRARPKTRQAKFQLTPDRIEYTFELFSRYFNFDMSTWVNDLLNTKDVIAQETSRVICGCPYCEGRQYSLKKRSKKTKSEEPTPLWVETSSLVPVDLSPLCSSSPLSPQHALMFLLPLRIMLLHASMSLPNPLSPPSPSLIPPWTPIPQCRHGCFST